jgi:hypothetical protein
MNPNKQHMPVQETPTGRHLSAHKQTEGLLSMETQADHRLAGKADNNHAHPVPRHPYQPSADKV